MLPFFMPARLTYRPLTLTIDLLPLNYPSKFQGFILFHLWFNRLAHVTIITSNMF